MFTSKINLDTLQKGERIFIFLAGSIDYSINNWRNQLSEKFSDQYHFLDPTHHNLSCLSNEELKKHIQWELDGLSIADLIILNLLPNSQSPISLVEMGLYVKSGKLIVICPKEFYKSRYVYTLCEKYNAPVFNEIKQVEVYLEKENNLKVLL